MFLFGNILKYQQARYMLTVLMKPNRQTKREATLKVRIHTYRYLKYPKLLAAEKPKPSPMLIWCTICCVSIASIQSSSSSSRSSRLQRIGSHSTHWLPFIPACRDFRVSTMHERTPAHAIFSYRKAKCSSAGACLPPPLPLVSPALGVARACHERPPPPRL